MRKGLGHEGIVTSRRNQLTPHRVHVPETYLFPFALLACLGISAAATSNLFAEQSCELKSAPPRLQPRQSAQLSHQSLGDAELFEPHR
ncbi:uncharacterized protein CTRU02_211123 [Colletotrichum truncatum]|uniref:Uncharacterized protein n=1 Tax=Colletotrichum truncatum TaxID=5467 RepID=A0ACC3YQW3_COLTU